MCKGLHSIVWFLVALFVFGCGEKKQADDPILVKNIEPQLQLLKSTDQNERHNHSFIALSGEIVLGPVVAEHSLELVLYTDQLVELAKPTIDSQGSYTAKFAAYFSGPIKLTIFRLKQKFWGWIDGLLKQSWIGLITINRFADKVPQKFPKGKTFLGG